MFISSELVGADHGVRVDHRNGDGLDNRRENLRLCTQAQNMTNYTRRCAKSSRFRGVHLHACGLFCLRDAKASTVRQYVRDMRIEALENIVGRGPENIPGLQQHA